MRYHNGVKVVLDTDVIVAGMRSPRGASAELLRRARSGEITLLASVGLFFEYEAKCTLETHYRAAGLTREQVQIFLDTLALLVLPVKAHYLWRPQLRDPADEMVLETAVNGGADVLVSFNQRHFAQAPAHFGIDLLLPSQLMERIR